MRKRHTFLAFAVAVLLLVVVFPLCTVFLLSIAVLLTPAVPMLALGAVMLFLGSGFHAKEPDASSPPPPAPNKIIYAN